MVLACLVVLAGCNIGLEDFGTGTAPPPPPTRRPAATAASTAVQTPEPTEEPEASETATGKPTSFAIFRRHMRATFKAAKPITWNKARSPRLDEVSALSAKGRKWADAEMAWLLAHRPRDCYAAFYADWQQNVSVLSEGFTAIEDGIANDDFDQAMRGLEMLESLDDLSVQSNYSPITCRR